MDWSSAREWLLKAEFTVEDDASAEPRVYVGPIETQFGTVNLRLYLDLKCIAFPLVQLVRKPGWLPGNCAHLNSHLYLCCTDKSTAAPDRRDPQQIVEHVVNRARKLLEELVINGGHVADEFVKLWSGEDHTPSGYLPPSDEMEDAWLLVRTVTGDWQCVVPASRLKDVKAWLGVTSASSCHSPIHINVEPELIAGGPGWPIRSLGHLGEWLEFLDGSARRELQRAVRSLSLEVASAGLSGNSLFVLLHSGHSVLGILFDIHRLMQWLPTGARRRPQHASRQIERALLRRTCGTSLKYRFVNIESSRMLARAMGGDVPDLSGKRIVLIGAGSVGSHVGMGLARSGAGADGGNLTIYDPDTVSVENIVRSAFDTRHIGINKAEALASMLRGTLVGISISPAARAAPTVTDELAADLVVDASGDHAFSTWLSEQKLTNKVPPILFCWVSGPGAAAVTYLQAEMSDSCLACLGVADAGSPWNPLNAHNDPGHLTGPCGESFMPYSVGAPMLAGGLAVSHALDWARDNWAPSMRSIILSPAAAKALPPESPPTCGCAH